jgi:hypothetical protein
MSHNKMLRPNVCHIQEIFDMIDGLWSSGDDMSDSLSLKFDFNKNFRSI